jgi:dTDP-4-amino-4,6-dideoxygalactose transaminase
MIQVFKPKIRTEEVFDEMKKIFNSGWIGLGPKTQEFESKVAQYLNTNYFVATNGCTGALHIAIRCLDLPNRSKILTTPITFVSTNAAILYENHIPVFCDVEPETGIMCVKSLETHLEKYGNEVGAILVVHLGGYACEMKEINALAKKYNVKVIEDCAHAFGASYEGKKIGDTENICVWSFQAVKNMPVGDGGGISTRDENIAKRAKRLIWLGADKTTIERSGLDSNKQTYNWDYEVIELGYKYHTNDIASVIGLNNLKYIDIDNTRRKEISEYYKNNIIRSGIDVPEYKDNRRSSYHFFPILFDDRFKVYSALKEKNIYPGMHYKRNDNYSLFKEYSKYSIGELNGVENYASKELTLPIHLHLTNDELKLIVDTINNCL